MLLPINRNLASLLLVLPFICACTPKSTEAVQEEVNDSNTPLHLLTPEYQVPYGETTQEEVKAVLDRIFTYIDLETPMSVEEDGKLKRGAFRIASYEWGVTYQALMEAARITQDERYQKYVDDHFAFIRQQFPEFQKKTDIQDGQMEQIVHPKALDDCGAMCTAMMKAAVQKHQNDVPDEVIENYFDFIEHRQYRLPDGSFARHRPQRNTIWLDDMFMGIPALAYRGVYCTDHSYFDQAASIFHRMAERMWVPGKKLYRHGYVEGLHQQPTYHWARANGWAILTTVELLDVLPETHPERPFILNQLQMHIQGLADLQSSEGFWHQLLDRNDSYLETSATAIYTYCIAHAVRRGWVDGITYGPVAQLGWHAVSTKVQEDGRVAGTCVGTGMAFDPAFYYYRPVSSAAAHGYGPAIWAATEMYALLGEWHPRTNDSGLHYYEQEQTNPSPLFYLTEDGTGEEVVW